MRSTHTILTAILLVLASLGVAEAGWEEGVAAFKAGNYTAAAKEFQAVVEEQPDWPGGHRMLGETFLKMNQQQQALIHLRKAYDLKPDDVNNQLALGKALFTLGRYRDAAELLGNINLSSLPKAHQEAVSRMLGVSLQKSGQYDEALAQLRKAAQANPNDAVAQYNYGIAAFQQDDTATAVTALGKAVSLDPNDTTKQVAYIKALIRRGRELRDGGKTQVYEKAAAAASGLVRREPTYDHLLLLGEAQLGAGQYPQAVATFEQAQSKRSSEWLPSFYIGQAYTANRQYRQAERPLKAALELTSDQKNQLRIWKQLGFVYEKQKSFPAAKEAYQRAGDAAGIRRVEENERISQENLQIEEHNRLVKEMEEEAKALEEELKSLPGSAPPPR